MLKKTSIEEGWRNLVLKKAQEAIAPYLTVMLLMHELLRYVVSYLPYVFHSESLFL